MLSFKRYIQLIEEVAGRQFTQFLFEELNDKQKALVNTWTETPGKSGVRTRNISNHVFGEGERVTIPLEHPDSSTTTPVQPHPKVVEHLKSAGYDVDDYAAGTAKDEYGRPTRIGKVLEKTKAPDEVKQAFQADRPKTAKRKVGGLSVVISRHPHDVAGMSTGQGWTSCMDMGSGCNSHYLKDDVKQGTHVAYLVHSHDTEVKSPLARIALKPFVGDKSTILRPETRTYGTADSAFHHTVSQWAEKNFPMEKGETYSMARGLYDDSSIRHLAHPDTAIRHEDSEVVYNYLKMAHSIPREHYEIAMKHPDPAVRETAFRHHATPEDITNVINGNHPEYSAYDAVKARNLTPDHINKLLVHPNEEVVRFAIKHPNASSENLHKALEPNQPESVQHTAIEHPNIKPEHIDKILNSSGDDDLKSKAILHPNANSRNIDTALNSNQSVYVRRVAIRHPNASSDNIHKALNDSNIYNRFEAIEHPLVNSEHIETALSLTGKENEEIRSRAIEHPNATSEQISRGLDLSSPIRMRLSAISNPSATPEHISKALDDPDEHVRRFAVYHPNMSSDNLHKALGKDQPSDIASYALYHPNVKPEHINTALNHPSEEVKATAIKLKKMTGWE